MDEYPRSNIHGRMSAFCKLVGWIKLIRIWKCFKSDNQIWGHFTSQYRLNKHESNQILRIYNDAACLKWKNIDRTLNWVIIAHSWFEIHSTFNVPHRRATRGGGAGGCSSTPSLSRTGHTIRPDSMSFYFVNVGGGGRETYRAMFGSSVNKWYYNIKPTRLWLWRTI